VVTKDGLFSVIAWALHEAVQAGNGTALNAASALSKLPTSTSSRPGECGG